MQLEIGDYVKHYQSGANKGTLVRIAKSTDGGTRGTVYGIDYVQVVSDAEVTGGGSSFWWEAREFGPLTDARDILAAEAYEAKRQAGIAENEAEKQRQAYRAKTMALAALRRALESAKAADAVARGPASDHEPPTRV